MEAKGVVDLEGSICHNKKNSHQIRIDPIAFSKYTREHHDLYWWIKSY